MFVTIVNFPPVKTGKHGEFFEWFMKTNKDFEQQYGFIRRKLLKPMNGSTYAALIEHESYETFMAMHKSDELLEVVKVLADQLIQLGFKKNDFELATTYKKNGIYAEELKEWP